MGKSLAGMQMQSLVVISPGSSHLVMLFNNKVLNLFLSQTSSHTQSGNACPNDKCVCLSQENYMIEWIAKTNKKPIHEYNK